jgi:hypothetical protein
MPGRSAAQADPPDGDEDTARARYNQIDFESDEEWAEVYSTGKGPGLMIARTIARQEPQAALQLVLGWLSQTIADIPDPAKGVSPGAVADVALGVV